MRYNAPVPDRCKKEQLIRAGKPRRKAIYLRKESIMSEFEKHSAEAKQKWGETAAYKEYEQKSKNYSEEKRSELVAEMDAIFAEFSLCLKGGETPASPNAQALVKKLRDHISENYYNCSDEILSGLGKMYTADERFRNNINRHAEGTAEFVSKAIEAFCVEG